MLISDAGTKQNELHKLQPRASVTHGLKVPRSLAIYTMCVHRGRACLGSDPSPDKCLSSQEKNQVPSKVLPSLPGSYAAHTLLPQPTGHRLQGVCSTLDIAAHGTTMTSLTSNSVAVGF